MNTYKFKKLTVWKRSIDYVTFIYQLTSKLPRDERFGLTDQLRRAAVSVSLNIAEGSGCGSDIEFVRFLRMAQRSMFEVITALEITRNLNLVEAQALDQALKEADEISAMLTGLIKSLKANS